LRCVGCKGKVKGKNLDSLKDSGGRCPHCGHRFVADPAKDGIGDVAVAKAVERVSAEGKVRFLPEHLGYELQRRVSARRARGRAFLAVGAVLALVVLFLALKKMIIVAFVVAIVAFGLLAAGLARRRQRDMVSLAARFLAVNPSPHAVPPTTELVEAARARWTPGLAVARRIVVCQHTRHAEFLVANDFALQFVCPVLGPGGSLIDLYPGLAERLAQSAAEVFVLHDFTPEGVAFARTMRELPQWLGRASADKLCFVGLAARHLPYLRPMLRPLAADASRQGALFRHGVTELTAVRPALLISALGRSLEDRQPLRLERERDETDDVASDSE
jgi:DNA-directed RNA polymerase subunit RPC12/RpoP